MENIKIVIVGAGIAGIGAAESLIANGFTNVTIIEGANRIGGRINTQNYGNSTIEMGAQWIHGEDNNPVFELACAHDLLDHMAQRDQETKESLFYTSTGQFICPSVIRETGMMLDNIFNEANKFARESIPLKSEEDTVGTFVQEAFYNNLRSSTDTEEVKKMKDGLFNWRLTMEKTENGCASVYDMSLCAWGEYIQCAGEEAVELSRGYQPILDLILKNIPKDSFCLGTRVEKIIWNQPSDKISDKPQVPQTEELEVLSNEFPSKIKIVTSTGSTIIADHVIVTCSLGYLKAHSDELFSPPLPRSKNLAISRLGFGTVNKIYLEFEKPFWNDLCGGIQMAWLPDDHITLKCLEGKTSDKGQSDSRDWYRGIHGFDVVAQHTNLLCGWIAGTEAEMLESLPDEEVIDVCHELLCIFTNQSNIERPTKITRTNWFSNECTLGSYSYRHTGSNSNDSLELGKPLPSEEKPFVQFAGEATHPAYFSTTHGALLSGQREANRIIKHYLHKSI